MTRSTVLLAGAILLGFASTATAGYEGIDQGSYRPTNVPAVAYQNGSQAFARAPLGAGFATASITSCPSAFEKDRMERASQIH